MISPVADHSSLFGAPRHQGMRLTCLAFTVSDLNRHTASAPDALSPEYLYQCAGSSMEGWKLGDGLYLDNALQAAKTPGQPLEALFPYLSAAPTASSFQTLAAGTTLYCSTLKRLPATQTAVVNRIKKGHAVGLVVACTNTLYAPVDGIVGFSSMVIPNAAHAVLAVGVGSNAFGVEHVLIRNSWGANWGVDGHAWLPKQYVDMHAIEAFGS
jgi:hypothetical protein